MCSVVVLGTKSGTGVLCSNFIRDPFFLHIPLGKLSVLSWLATRLGESEHEFKTSFKSMDLFIMKS